MLFNKNSVKAIYVFSSIASIDKPLAISVKFKKRVKIKVKSNPIYFEPEELEPVLRHIDKMWSVLTVHNPDDHGTLIGLPYPYVVPSSRATDGFAYKELYYWDSFFIGQGLLKSRHKKLAGHILEDLLYLQRRFGMIPNGNRFYLTARSQPPFLTTYILDVYRELHKSKRWLAKAMQVAESEYLQVWMNSNHPNWHRVFEGLSRHYDINVLHEMAEAGSGWDMSPRFEGKCLDYLPVDLNALLYKYEKDFELAAILLDRPEDVGMWARRAYRRKTMMNKLMWDEEAGFYFDYNFKTGQRSKTWSLAAYFPLWADIVSEKQATRLVENLSRFQYVGGLASTDRTSAKSTYEQPLQWEYPNGWAPLHWVVVQGLVEHGFREEADVVVRSWLKTNVQNFYRHDAMLEKYNVVHPHKEPKHGVYPSQEGFGWTNGVFFRFCHDYLLKQELPENLGQANRTSTLADFKFGLPTIPNLPGPINIRVMSRSRKR